MFEQGREKTGGREKGTPNKSSVVIKEMIGQLLTDNIEEVKTEFKSLKGRDKIRAFTDLLPYVIPKLQSVSNAIKWDDLTDEQLDEVFDRLTKGENQQ